MFERQNYDCDYTIGTEWPISDSQDRGSHRLGSAHNIRHRIPSVEFHLGARFDRDDSAIPDGPGTGILLHIQ
jgi:hypothetical protein